MSHDLKQIVDAQKTEISVSAVGDFGDMKDSVQKPGALSRMPVLQCDECVVPPFIARMRCSHQGSPGVSRVI